MEVSRFITQLITCFSLIFSNTGDSFLSSSIILFGIYGPRGNEGGLKEFCANISWQRKIENVKKERNVITGFINRNGLCQFSQALQKH